MMLLVLHDLFVIGDYRMPQVGGSWSQDDDWCGESYSDGGYARGRSIRIGSNS